LREKLEDDKAIDVLKEALAMDPSNNDLVKLYEETK